jgi:23S rRNA (cytosine1962-C5)-methyltransferase
MTERLPEEPVHGAWPEGSILIEEHGLRYEVEARSGQKTGFYLDQRENRLAVRRYAAGREVLDLFCYTGGFSLNALEGGAKHAVGIDSSVPAIEQARRNAVINGQAHARFEHADVFEAIHGREASGQRFGLIVCDPPRYARSADHVEDALKAYAKLNRAAIGLLEPEGILVTCSCSGHVGRELFAEMLARVSQETGRTIQFLEQRGQPADHPVSASCLETEYLKCFVCRVG